MRGKFRATGLALVILAAATAVGGAAAARATAPKVPLKVDVRGKGTVTAVGGLHCPHACVLHLVKGGHVTLTATHAKGWSFVGWLGASSCAIGRVCTTKVDGAHTVTAVFQALPPSSPPQPLPPPPPPPPPPPKAGHYSGSYSDGSSPLTFDVSSTGGSVTNFSFDTNGHCGDDYTLSSTLHEPGPFTLQTDGSFSVSDSFKDSDGNNWTVSIFGHVGAQGSASGTISVGITFGDGVACTSSGNWSATSA